MFERGDLGWEGTGQRETERTTSRRRWRTVGRRVGLTSLVAGALVASLMLLPAVGATPVPQTTHGAPFHGKPILAHAVASAGCGGTASFMTLPTFDLTTGIGRMNAKSSATGCGAPGLSDFGSTNGTTGLASVEFVGRPAGYTAAWFNLSYNFSFNLSATLPNPSGGPFAWAVYTATFSAAVWDLTTSTHQFGCNSIYSDSTNGSATGNVSGEFYGPAGCGLTGALNFTAGHLYVVELYAVLFEMTHAPSGTKTHATALLNMATGPRKFRALNWTLS
jgi:hypothetical protein